MSTFVGSSFYHVERANTNRVVSFQIVTQSGLSNSFFFIDGNNAFPPFIGEKGHWSGINGGAAETAPTVNQIIANYRLDYVVRYLSVYAIPVNVAIASVVVGGGEVNNAVVIAYETYVSNVLPNVSDITDTLGVTGTAKTKSGLQTLATALISTASLDGGATLLFAVNPNLPDGTATTAAAVTALTVTAL